MKVNIQKLTRAIPCFLTAFAVVLVCTVRASATAQYIDPYKYITGTETSGSIEYVNVSFTGVQPVTWYGSGTSETNVTGLESVDLTAGSIYPYFKTWLIGVEPTNTTAPDGSIRVAEIMAGSTMELTTTFNFTLLHGVSGYGGTVNMEYRGQVYCYDSDGKFMQFVNGDFLEWSEQVTGSADKTINYSMTFDLPSGCAYICPVSRLNMTANIPNAGNDNWYVQMRFESEHFGMTVVRDSFASNSQNNQEITDRLDSIINGSDADNKDAQEGANKADDAIGGLNNAGNAMDSVPTPNVNINGLIPDDLTGQSYLKYTSVISEIWNTEVIARMMSILGCFIFLSFLLYGKKG